MKPKPGQVSLENLRADVDRLALLADDRSFVVTFKMPADRAP
jgi:hypothetical protein